jgi:glycine/D-amino acid oxidase-like deaminating enzyme
VTKLDSLVVGGGFFGCRIALHLRAAGRSVVLVEQEPDLLLRASQANQARVHQGYHYPRSVLTAIRSRVNFARFVGEYPECIDASFDKYYAIGRQQSAVTAAQFQAFCQRIGAPLEPAGQEVRALFDRQRIEAVFRVQEYAFDADRLRERMRQDLARAGVEVRLRTRALAIGAAPGGLAVELDGPAGPERLLAGGVLNCTYSGINHLLAASGLQVVPLKHESTEMALVEPPPELKGAGVTVMCGPFFSIMPFPPRGLHTLSHVRFTPHREWHEQEAAIGPPGRQGPEPTSNQDRMVRDASRYLPCMEACVYRESIWEVKTVLPSSEGNDSRPILFRPDHGLPGLTCVMGGKIDNVYDVLDEMEKSS